MSDTLNIAIAQINLHLGAIEENLAKIRAVRVEAARLGADLVVTPELSIAGYPPEDLVLKPAFVAACEAAAEELAKDTADGGPGLIVGLPWRDGDKLYNAAFLLDGGRIVARRCKVELPNYGVFDEKRVFNPGLPAGPVPFRGFRLGLMICEDWWLPHVAETLAETGAEMLLSINGSPFEDGKQSVRVTLAVERVVETELPYVFAAQVCGQDEVVFDGASFVLNADRTLAVQMPYFEEAVTLTNWTRTGAGLVCAKQPLPPEPGRFELIYQAMMWGLRDYVNKNGFPGVVLGLSGGIDSAISAAVAADALGPERVRAVMLPSPYTSAHSLEDAAACADMLGIPYETIPISGAMDAFTAALAPAFAGKSPDITEENIQSRARGLILMAISNKFGPMLLTTGNKSEMSVGYATLYGDMCGGYSVLKDIYKTTVFEISHWRNANHPKGALTKAGPAMPERIITKPPSAELRENQTDQDSLPPYEVLDAILEHLIEGERSADEIVAQGFDRPTVLRVIKLLDRAEYKRRQAPPGVKITAKAFGRDRRYPLTNGFTNLIK
ncbi:NAD+ synthase [Acidocella aminolytica]|uniref:Glutamine-dependent NAD(+) synthetase n=1 Tax=Acidocella aminolytica 101 = DSM 11237 TaxID=1120923 RepID=A0A0D6PGC9_9PROT|nr:NAD+ synthase [Acidocella aminolytica]GAN79899.1 NAD(+) synthetase [Acidocella aminolytica 101 = DSM 11237]GBQ41019.1 NAD synthetase [Acidocella aminolytica 101 = DSM 11237]SHE59918.1 NAD+ synthase [Acidocella aminolytica 101 = DSM 11237]